MPSTESRTFRRSGAGDGESGFVLVWFALLLTIFIAMAGLGVDVWNWWQTAQQVQRAADAGATAGVTFLPSDFASARSTAFDLVERNGYDSANTTVQLGDAPSKLKVTVTHETDNFFTHFFGVDTTVITRSATAEFTGPTPIGSPINHLGNQPIGDGDALWPSGVTDSVSANPQVWLQIAGPGNNKNNGDRFTSNQCAQPGNGPGGVWECPASGNNQEYSADGYYFIARIEAEAGDLGKDVAIEVYDPAFVQTGDNCTDFLGADRGALAALGARYDSNTPANNRTFCTGDHRINSVTYGAGFPTTTFTTFRPDATPWQVGDNVPVNQVGCNSAEGVGTFRPYGTRAGETAATLPAQVALPGSYANQVFHRWVQICRVSLASLGVTAPGQYDIPIQVEAGAGSGHNRFAMRSALINASNVVDGTRTSVFAFQHLPLYQNAEAADSRFYLARVLPSGQNRLLAIQMFDVGDGSGSGSITIVPPGSNTFTGCTGQRLPATLDLTFVNGCTLNNVNSANYQAQRIAINVPIPSSYTCDVSDPLDCWVQVRFNWSAGVQDTTTWSAGILGDPVRLIE